LELLLDWESGREGRMEETEGKVEISVGMKKEVIERGRGRKGT
jgi:hypothetical protein